MGRLLRIAARVTVSASDDTVPIEGDKVDDLITLLKRQLDLLTQAAKRDNPQRAMKLLEGTYSALQAVLNLITRGHDEVTDRREIVEDKLDQATQKLRPIRMQIH